MSKESNNNDEISQGPTGLAKRHGASERHIQDILQQLEEKRLIPKQFLTGSVE